MARRLRWDRWLLDGPRLYQQISHSLTVNDMMFPEHARESQYGSHYVLTLCHSKLANRILTFHKQAASLDVYELRHPLKTVSGSKKADFYPNDRHWISRVVIWRPVDIMEGQIWWIDGLTNHWGNGDGCGNNRSTRSEALLRVYKRLFSQPRSTSTQLK